MGTLYERAVKTEGGGRPFLSSYGHSYSYGDFSSLCRKAYDSLGFLRPGEVLLCHLPSSIEWLATLMASLERGIHFLPIYEGHTPEERDVLREKIHPHGEMLASGHLRPLYSLSEGLDLPAGIIFQTSGGMGPSRFVHQSGENLLDNARRAARHQKIDCDSKIFMPLTFSHSGGLNMQTLPAFTAGAEVYLASKRSIGDWRKIFDGSYTHAVLVPYHLRRLMELPEWASADFSGKMTILTGSCPISGLLFKKTAEKAAHLLGVYGLTEIGPFVSTVEMIAGPPEENIFPIGDGNGDYHFNISPENSEILVKGPCTGRYINRNKSWGWETHPCGGPWVKTGDRGEIREGQVYYLGKIKREINLAGLKINPEEVEEALREHPKVSDCFVYAVSRGRWGEVPTAKVVAHGVARRELRDFLKGKMAVFKIPHSFIFVEKLGERTSIGKVKAA